MKGFLQRTLQEIMKKNNTWNIRRFWLTIRLSHCPSDPAYYIVNWRILRTDNKWGSSYVELLTLVSLRFLVFYGISSQKGWVISDFAKCTAKYHIRHSSKSVWVIKLSFSQKDLLIGESFWENNRLVTPLLFELCLIMIFSPVANFGHHPLCTFC